MKTAEILSKYKRTVSALLQVGEKGISFYVDKKLVGETFSEYDEDKDETNTFYQTWQLGYYELKLNEKLISSFKLYQLPHCCAYAVSCNSFVTPEFRGKRIATFLNHLRQDICRELGYSGLLCTDIETNTAQRKLLATNGWKDIHSLVNKRTKNHVYLSVINL